MSRAPLIAPDRFFDAWEGDPALRACTMAAQGFLMRCLAVMRRAEPAGYMMVGKRACQAEDMARLTGQRPENARAWMKELIHAGILEVDEQRRIFHRGMVESYKIRNASKVYGSMGGNPALRPDNPAKYAGRLTLSERRVNNTAANSHSGNANLDALEDSYRIEMSGANAEGVNPRQGGLTPPHFGHSNGEAIAAGISACNGIEKTHGVNPPLHARGGLDSSLDSERGCKDSAAPELRASARSAAAGLFAPNDLPLTHMHRPAPQADTGGGASASAGEGESGELGTPKRKAGTKRKIVPTAAEREQFERFWLAYPHRGPCGNPKRPALEKFCRLVRDGVEPEEIVTGAMNYHAACRMEGITRSSKVAMAITFLNQARYDDFQQPPEPGSVPEGHRRQSQPPLTQADAVRLTGTVPKNAGERAALWKFFQGGSWREKYGPPPGDPDCKIPRALIEEVQRLVEAETHSPTRH